jgi:hypothetical protein
VPAEPAGPEEFLARLVHLEVLARLEVTALLVVLVPLVVMVAPGRVVGVERTGRPGRKVSTEQLVKLVLREPLLPAGLPAAQVQTAVWVVRGRRALRVGTGSS